MAAGSVLVWLWISSLEECDGPYEFSCTKKQQQQYLIKIDFVSFLRPSFPAFFNLMQHLVTFK